MATITLPASRHAGSPSGEEVLMGASAREPIEEGSMVHCVCYQNRDGLHEVRSSLTVGADGRFSRLRRLAEFDSDRRPLRGQRPPEASRSGTGRGSGRPVHGSGGPPMRDKRLHTGDG